MVHELLGIFNNQVHLRGKDLKDNNAPGNVYLLSSH